MWFACKLVEIQSGTAFQASGVGIYSPRMQMQRGLTSGKWGMFAVILH
jgi:hypothetical protein